MKLCGVVRLFNHTEEVDVALLASNSLKTIAVVRKRERRHALAPFDIEYRRKSNVYGGRGGGGRGTTF